MLKHLSPRGEGPSGFLRRAWDRGLLPKSAESSRCLDLACGFGRNAVYLSSKYSAVVAGDYDPDVLATGWYRGFKNIFPVLLDGRADLPLADQSFDLVTVVHFYDDALLPRLARILRNDGVLLMESIGNRGENWRELPRRASFEAMLHEHFELISYEHKAVAKAPEYSTFKLIARNLRVSL